MNDVYLITNTVNGKQYVGITCRGYLNRWREHVLSANSGSKTILHNAIRKYGEDVFNVELLASDIPNEDIRETEISFISKYHTFYSDGGYNMTYGGGGVAGLKHSESTKSRISNSLKGHVFPESRNKKISEAHKHIVKDEKWRNAISKSRLGKYKGEDNPFYGKHHSDATKCRIREANSGSNIEQLDLNSLEVLNTFYNLNDAGRWVVENNLSKAHYTTCAVRIGEVSRSTDTRSAYGYKWRKVEEGQSTN